ncbi:MAG: hypothetical protein PHC83_05975 [Bacteroidales bacterium]|nr:hypothetical protein [Bacteroidales bacterium]
MGGEGVTVGGMDGAGLCPVRCKKLQLGVALTTWLFLHPKWHVLRGRQRNEWIFLCYSLLIVSLG